MSAAFYTGGHSLADLIRDLYQLFHSLSKVQDALAELFISGEIVPSEELGQDWYLKWASVYEEGDGWADFGGRKIMIVVAGKPRDPAEIRYHSPSSEPRPLTPSEPAVKEELPQPDPSPVTPGDDPPTSDVFMLPSGRWHVLAVVLEGWHRGGLSIPLMQEYLVRLTENGAIKLLSEALPVGWMMSSQRVGGSVSGKKHFVFIAPGEKELWADEIACQLTDPRILDPRLLHLFLAPAVAGTTPPKDDIDPPSEEHPGTAPEAEAVGEAEPAVVSRRGKDPEHSWEDAADYAEEKTEKTKLPRHPDGSPNIQRGIDLMREWFEKYDPPPPTDGSIRRWIKDNWLRTSQWWGAGD